MKHVEAISQGLDMCRAKSINPEFNDNVVSLVCEKARFLA